MANLLIFIFFVLGLIIGSFLNVVIFRYNTSRSLGGRSACMSCQKELSWYELIPLFSFIFLWGRCRNCKTRLSLQYPLVELATALIFVGLFLKLGGLFFDSAFSFAVTYVFYATLFSLLIVIAAYDIHHKIVPDMLVAFFGVLAFLGLFFFSNYDSPGLFLHLPRIFELSAGVLIALPFALLWLVSSGRWMGLGDAKLALGLGWLLLIPGALYALVLAFWFGAIIGVVLILASRKYKLKSEIPFAPFLILGSLLVFFFNIHLFVF